jgi:N-acyl-D-aspartate/D-glutamate deacylase
MSARRKARLRRSGLMLTVLLLGAGVWPGDLFGFDGKGEKPAVRKQVPSLGNALLISAMQMNVPPEDHQFSVAIEGGRVMDPETGLDQVLNVGIDDGTITALTPADLNGKQEIDASGLVVSPGFIDILSYDPNPYGIWFKIGDGVTTNLGMHGVSEQAATWFAQWEYAGSPAHYGAAFDHAFTRGTLMGIGTNEESSREQVQALAEYARQDLEAGFIGVDFELEYSAGASYAEVKSVSQVAADFNVPAFFHGRYSDMEEPGTNFDTLNEILRASRETGASVHVSHINSTGGTFTMERSLEVLNRARRNGVDVTACTYPYTFWATNLASDRFAPGWQERFRIDYDDLVIPGTGERLTEETFDLYQSQKQIAAAYAIPEDDVKDALASPLVMVGSDGILEPDENNHPRDTGTFARVLGTYVRDEKVLSLMEALRKMTVMPAKRLEGQAPALRKKGRLQIGMDADITLFDPETVADRSTITAPDRMSAGIEWVLVMGQVVKNPKGPRYDVTPGFAIKSDFSNL